MPQQVLTSTFLVTNNTGKKRTFQGEVQLPEGWQSINAEFPFELEAGERDVRLISFSVPVTAQAGHYTLKYVVQDQSDGSIRGEDKIELDLAAVGKIELQQETLPEEVIAGAPYQAVVRIINRGNSSNHLKVEVDSSDGFPAVAVPSELILAPGTSQKITIAVKTLKEIQHRLPHHLTIRVKAKEAADLTGSLTTTVSVYPRMSGGGAHHYLSTQFGLSRATESGVSLTNLQFSGSGFLDAGETLKTEFLLSQPVENGKELSGLRDEYRLSLQGKFAELRLGDRLFNLSQLTEQGKFALGAEGKLNFGGLQLSGFYMKTRRGLPIDEAVAASVGYEFAKDLRLDLHFLNRQTLGAFNADLLSIEGLVRPWPFMKLEMEYAHGRKRQGGSSSGDNAWRFKVEGVLGVSSNYLLEKLHAGDNFPGSFFASDTTRGAVNLSLLQGLRLSAAYNESQNNVQPALNIFSSARTKFYQAGVDYQALLNTLFSLSYEGSEQQNLQPLADPDVTTFAGSDFQTQALRFEVQQSFPSQFLTFLATTSYGRLQDNLTGLRQTLKKFGLQANFNPAPSQQYHVYFQTGLPNFLSQDPKKETTIGLSANLTLLEGLTAGIGFETVNAEGSPVRNQWFGNLYYHLPYDHLLSLTVRHTDVLAENQDSPTSLLVSYQIPIGIPIGRKVGISAMRGRVFDSLDPLQKGVPDVMVRVGEVAAITDYQGQFALPTLPAGVQHLWVDRKGLGPQRIPADRMPLEFTMVPGKDQHIDIGITRAATVKVRAALFRPAKGTGLITGQVGTEIVEDKGFASLLLELTDGVEVRRGFTDEAGLVTLDDVRPGKWKLLISEDDLPELHYLEKNELALDLQPGIEEQVVIKILPQIRKLVMIDEEPVPDTPLRPTTPRSPVKLGPPASPRWARPAGPRSIRP